MANRIGNFSPLHLGHAQDDSSDSNLGREAGKTTRATQGTRGRWEEDNSLGPDLVDWEESDTPPDASSQRISSSEPILRGSARESSVNHANNVSRKAPSLVAPAPVYLQKTVSIMSARPPRRRPADRYVGISGDEAAQQGFWEIPNNHLAKPGRLSKIESSSDEESSEDEPSTSQNKGHEDTREFEIFGMEL